jgi:hypothetical protein
MAFVETPKIALRLFAVTGCDLLISSTIWALGPRRPVGALGIPVIGG